jgi:hypothetical protein
MGQSVCGGAEVRELVDLVGLDPAARRRLGLRPSERLRLVEVSEAAVVLLREPPADDLPVEGPPCLRADVAFFPLAEILSAVHTGERSGLLVFRYRDHAKSVYFHRGEVVFATSNQRVDRLGECLLRAGVIALEQLREGERCYRPPGRFGKVLVERGFLTPRELWNGVKYQVEEIVRSLFAYPGGVVCFWPADVQPDNVVRLSLETRRLVSEGLQRRDELRKFLAVLGDPRVRLATVQGVGGQLAGHERALVDAIGAERPFAEVCRVLGFDQESAARSIQLLRLVGAVKLVRCGHTTSYLGEQDLERPDQEAVRARIASLVKLIAELAAAVAAAEGSAQVDERLARILDEVTGRHPALLTGVSLGPGGTLDPDLLSTRALRLPGDREEQLVAALGELVTYLEFEIKNHPGIGDPEAVLASVEGLRAVLAQG